MVAKRKRPTKNQIFKAEIGRFDGELKTVAFKKGDKISDLASRAGISMSTGDSVNDARGNDIALDSAPKAGATYLVTGSYKNGCN
jgi:hypothetical protein